MNINGMHEVEMTLEKLIELVRLLSTDMYATACAMVNYVKIQPYGTTLFKPYGLGGGRVENDWGTEPMIEDTNTDKGSNNTNTRSTGHNSFLESL